MKKDIETGGSGWYQGALDTAAPLRERTGVPMEPLSPEQMTAVATGGKRAADSLFETLYSELHRLAQRELSRGMGRAVSLGVTTLLHEAYLGIGARNAPSFPDRARFLGYAGRVMRGLIIDHARRRGAEKRGGQVSVTILDEDVPAHDCVGHEQIVRIGLALDELMTVDRDLSEVVDLRFFCGLSLAEIACMRGVSERTVRRWWQRARIYLHASLRSPPV